MSTTAPSSTLTDAVAFHRAAFPHAEVFYSETGTAALILTPPNGDYDGGTVISVTSDGTTSSADLTDWSTGYDC